MPWTTSAAIQNALPMAAPIAAGMAAAAIVFAAIRRPTRKKDAGKCSRQRKEGAVKLRCTNPDCQFQFLPVPTAVVGGYSPQVVTVRCPRCNVWGAYDAELVTALLHQPDPEADQLLAVPAEFVAWYNAEGRDHFLAWKSRKSAEVQFTELDSLRLHGMGASL